MKEEQNNTASFSSGLKLPRTGILRGKTNFNRLFRAGKVINGAVSSIRYLVIQDEIPKQLMAFVVRKKIGNAVLRNRHKRLMREAYRHHQNILLALPNSGLSFHGAFMANKDSATLDEYQKDCKDFFTKILKKHLGASL